MRSNHLFRSDPMHTRVLTFSFITAIVVLAACGGSDTTNPTPPSKIVHFTASLTPAGEIGANLAGNPTGNGTFTATLDTSTNVFTYSVTFTGLTSNVTLGHIHGPFPSGTANTAV